MITYLQGLIERLRGQIVEGLLSELSIYAQESASKEADELRQELSHDRLNELLRETAVDFLITSVGTLALGWGFVALSVILAGHGLATDNSVLAVFAIVPAIELLSLPIPLGGWPAIFRGLYLFFFRLIPSWGRDGKLIQRLVLLFVIVQDGGWILVPLFSAYSRLNTSTSHFAFWLGRRWLNKSLEPIMGLFRRG